MEYDLVVIGAGPAGLTYAYELFKKNNPALHTAAVIRTITSCALKYAYKVSFRFFKRFFVFFII